MRFLRICLCLFCLPFSLQASDAEDLYTQNCAICHGSHGKGGVGIPLAMPAFLQQAPDEYLRRTIRLGRPGRVMPAFNQLTEKQIDLIVEHIRSWGKDIPAPRWDDRPITGNSQNGKQLYAAHCSSCHGNEGRGKHGTGVMFSRKKDLPIMAPAIGNPGFLHAANDQMIRDVILHGRPGTPMQNAQQLGLNSDQVDDLVSYLRGLEKPLQSPAETAEEEPASLVYQSSYSFEETIENVKRAAIGMNFRLIRDQALDQGLVPEGRENRQYMMVYFCNFDFLYQALAIDPRVGLFLPCRITVIEQQGKVQVMSINPRRLSRLFNNNELDNACDEMHKLYTGILEEATF